MARGSSVCSAWMRKMPGEGRIQERPLRKAALTKMRSPAWRAMLIRRSTGRSRAGPEPPVPLLDR